MWPWDGKQLGQTSDPNELIVADIGSVWQAVAELKHRAATYSELFNSIRLLAASHVWSGEAADAANDTLFTFPKVWITASNAHAQAAAALESYAWALEAARGKAEIAISEYERGQRVSFEAFERWKVEQARAAEEARRAGLPPPPWAPFVDPGEAIRTNAAGLLEDARIMVFQAGAEAAQQVDQAAESAPAGPGFFEQLASAAGDLLEAVAFPAIVVGQGLFGDKNTDLLERLANQARDNSVFNLFGFTNPHTDTDDEAWQRDLVGAGLFRDPDVRAAVAQANLPVTQKVLETLIAAGSPAPVYDERSGMWVINAPAATAGIYDLTNSGGMTVGNVFVLPPGESADDFIGNRDLRIHEWKHSLAEAGDGLPRFLGEYLFSLAIGGVSDRTNNPTEASANLRDGGYLLDGAIGFAPGDEYQRETIDPFQVLSDLR